MKFSHGGDRAGAGRPPLSKTSPTVKAAVRLSAVEREKLSRLGGSTWVRERVDSTPLKSAFSGGQERGPTVVTTLRMTQAQEQRYERLGGAHWLRNLLSTTPMPRKR